MSTGWGPKQEKLGVGVCMKRRIISLLMVVLMAVAVMITAAGCRREDTEPKTGGDTIIIGGAMSLTGIQGPLDAPAIEGIEVAIDEINASGGINGKMLEFRNMDSKSDPTTAAEVAKQLIDQGAVAIITSSDYDFGGPAARPEAGIAPAPVLPAAVQQHDVAINSLHSPYGTPPWVP